MIQEALFDVPVKPEPKGAQVPPANVTPVIQAEPLGACVKCGEHAELSSPGGTLYCRKHGYCTRRTCLKSVEHFVKHPRMGIWVCPCVVEFERKYEMEAIAL